MVVQYTPHLLPLSLATAFAVVGGLQAWRRRTGPVEVWGMLAQLGSGSYILTMLCLVTFTGRGPKELSLTLYLPAAVGVSVAFFVFTVHFTGRAEGLTRGRLSLVGAMPAVALLASLTNRAHHLLYDEVRVVEQGGTQVLQYSLEPGFYLIVAATYVFCAAFLGLLLQHIRRSRNVYRRMGIVLFLSLFVLVAASVLSMVQRSPLPHFLLFPYAYLFVSGFLILGTTSVSFLRALPVNRLIAPFRSGSQGQIMTGRATVMEEIDSGIITLDQNGVVVDINTMAKRMLGADRPVGSHVSEVAPTERILSDTSIRSIIEHGDALRELSEEVWVDADTGDRCYDVRVSALADDDTAGYVVLLHDITTQKEREQALREREAELEQQNQRLERQKKQLEHQNERLDRFAGIVSHDLRNPLNVAKGHLEFVGDQIAATEDPPVDPDNVETAGDSLDRMEAIIEDALTLARQGKAITETERLELGALVESSWTNVDTAAATIEFPEGVTIEGDEGRLGNVFENLFRNSIEHGEPDAAIRIGLLPDGFYIEDDGPGIPAERQDQVFDEGFTTNDDGTGFGLAIVSDVVRAHGWDIRVTAGAEGGARFEITGVEFPWSVAALADELDDVVDRETATDLIAAAAADAGVNRTKFDKETALSLLEGVADRLSDEHAASATTDLAQRLRGAAN